MLGQALPSLDKHFAGARIMGVCKSCLEQSKIWVQLWLETIVALGLWRNSKSGSASATLRMLPPRTKPGGSTEPQRTTDQTRRVNRSPAHHGPNPEGKPVPAHLGGDAARYPDSSLDVENGDHKIECGTVLLSKDKMDKSHANKIAWGTSA